MGSARGAEWSADHKRCGNANATECDTHFGQTDIARHLNATQITDLGGVDYDDTYRDRFRRSILHAAPTPIKDVGVGRTAVSSQVIGKMVHDALRWWRFPTEA